MQENRHYQNNPKLDPTLAVGCVNYVDEIGKHVMVIQKDGKCMVGTLGSVDHYGNLFLFNAYERICVGGQEGQYGDLSVGSVLIRGDSLAVTCEIDASLEKKLPMKKVPAQVILKSYQEENRRKAEREKKLSQGLKQRGIIYTGHESGFGDENF